MKVKILSCSHLGNEDCEFEAKGNVNEEVIAQMFEHASQEHPEKLAGMSLEKQAAMKQKMHDLLDAQESQEDSDDEDVSEVEEFSEEDSEED